MVSRHLALGCVFAVVALPAAAADATDRAPHTPANAPPPPNSPPPPPLAPPPPRRIPLHKRILLSRQAQGDAGLPKERIGRAEVRGANRPGAHATGPWKLARIRVLPPGDPTAAGCVGADQGAAGGQRAGRTETPVEVEPHRRGRFFALSRASTGFSADRRRVERRRAKRRCPSARRPTARLRR